MTDPIPNFITGEGRAGEGAIEERNPSDLIGCHALADSGQLEPT